MKTKYWRFAYDDSSLNEILSFNTLIFPDLSRWPLAKNKNSEKIKLELKRGHFIMLANYNLNTEMGTVKGVSKIIDVEKPEYIINWKKPIPSWSVTPNAQGGIQEWRNEGVFCFDVEPAKRYKFDALCSKLFK